MTIETIRQAFLWCAIINYGLLAFWGLLFLLARDPLYRLTGKWVRMSAEQFDTIQYAGILFYKVCIFLFNLVPYIALRIVG